MIKRKKNFKTGLKKAIALGVIGTIAACAKPGLVKKSKPKQRFSGRVIEELMNKPGFSKNEMSKEEQKHWFKEQLKKHWNKLPEEEKRQISIFLELEENDPGQLDKLIDSLRKQHKPRKKGL